jgi:hypothetical protein
VLVQQARAPDAARAEVDALIAGLAQPLASEQSPRERADLLLALIEDKHLGDFTGSQGRTVRAAAVQALLALGYPYALEVPPEALETRLSDTDAEAPQSLFSSAKGILALSFVVIVGLLMLIPAIGIASMFDDDTSATLVAIALVSGTTFIPALLVLLGHLRPSRLLRGLGNVMLILVSMLWLVPGIALLTQSLLGLIPMTVGGLFIASASAMESLAPSEPR